jgi:hypothetical protein
MRRTVFSLVVVLVACSVVSGAPSRQDLLAFHQAKHKQLHKALGEDLEELAAACEQQGLDKAAREVRASIMPLDEQLVRAVKLPVKVGQALPTDLPPGERQWRARLNRLREEYAKDVYLLSRRVLRAGFPSYAYDLVREVAHYDPDHKSARRLLGFVRYGDKWLTPFAARQVRERKVWNEKFGWLPESHVERYEKGQRYYRGRWISAEQEAELRRDFKNGWEIRTEHYLVKTNHSLERGVELAAALEDYYQFFFQTFASFFNTPQQMQQLFSGRTTSRRQTVSRPHRVHYFRTRDEYNQTLVRKIPQIAITNGLYYTTDRTAYFFHNAEADNESTLFHEATHQLFYESQLRDRRIAEDADFWIIEGIACYMESFRRDNGEYSVGDPKYARFQAARYRRLVDNYYVPLAKFARMSMVAFQTDPNISKNYSQASGLAHFFMHFEDGRYRDQLIQHLSQLYNANLKLVHVQPLSELTGVPFEELDRQYLEYIKQMQASIDRERRGTPAPVESR